MHTSSQRKAFATAACQVGVTLVTAPLLTIATSLQLSRPFEAVSIEQFKQVNQSSRSFQARVGMTTQEKPAVGFMQIIKSRFQKTDVSRT